MTFIEYCNNDLYAGLNRLRDAQKSGRLSCKIIFSDGTEYSKFTINEAKSEIWLTDNFFNNLSMDINSFVDLFSKNKIFFEIKERRNK